MEIIVDDRERSVIPYMEKYSGKYDIIYKVQRCNSGDYAVTYNGNIILLIERKTWVDLAASMRDGRKDNIQKMFSIRDEAKCKLAYIIEGNATPNFNSMYSNIPLKNLRAHLDHIVFRDDVHVFYSLNEDYTAQRLFELAKNYLTIIFKSEGPGKGRVLGSKTGPTQVSDQISDQVSNQVPNQISNLILNQVPNQVPTQVLDSVDSMLNFMDICTLGETDNLVETSNLDKTSITGGNSNLLQKRQENKINHKEQILRCLPYIGSILAPLLNESGISLLSIYNKNTIMKDIAILKYESGKLVGEKKAEKIVNGVFSIIKNKKYGIEILSTVPSVSTKTAKIIIETYNLKDILDGKVDKQMISELKKTEKTKVGKNAAENIFKTLCLV